MNASIQAVRAITGVYFQKLVTIGAVVGGILLVLLWALVIWLTTTVDPLWALFFVVLVPLTIIGGVVYKLLVALGNSVIPRTLSKTEKKVITDMGDKVFSVGETATTPWVVNLALIGKDVLRGKESGHIKQIISNTSSLRDDFMTIRRIFE